MPVEFDSIPQDVKHRIEEIGTADIVLGVPACGTVETLTAAAGAVHEALSGFPSLKTVLVHCDGASAAGDSPILLSCPAFGLDRFRPPAEALAASSRVLFAIGGRLGARACAVLASDAGFTGSESFQRLLLPVLEQDFDLAVPAYARNKFDGLLTVAILYPLTRSLYGRRIMNPVGADCVLSSRLLQRSLQSGGPAAPTSLVTSAVCGGFQVCQAHTGARLQTPQDQAALSSLLAQFLGPVFEDMERTAVFWQKIRGSQPVPTFGEAALQSETAPGVDVRPMIESFQLGFRNLHEIWGLVLPPASLFELKKLARSAQEQFLLPDVLWARIVYDFSLGYRLRVISRDHLLRALTPLYLAWLASYALEVRDAGAAAADQSIERLCATFESEKPYLQSRWRWPDRFSP